MQADLRGKLITEIQVRSCGDRFYKLWACNPSLFSKICPSEVQRCKVQEGEFGKNGSMIVWNYVLDGEAFVAKEVVENVDLEQKNITYRMIEGDLLNNHRSFSAHLQVMPKGDNDRLVRWSCEYEKLREDLPDPTSTVDLLVKMTKGTEAHLKN